MRDIKSDNYISYVISMLEKYTYFYPSNFLTYRLDGILNYFQDHKSLYNPNNAGSMNKSTTRINQEHKLNSPIWMIFFNKKRNSKNNRSFKTLNPSI